MAAPAEATTQNLNGKWTINKELSDNVDTVFAVQGISYLSRKAVSMVPITIVMSQYEAAPKPPSAGTEPVTYIDMVGLAAGMKGVNELRCLDNEARDHSDWFFGDSTCRSKWVKIDEIEDKFQKEGWIDENLPLIFTTNESKKAGWVVTQVWGFQNVNGERRFCKRTVATNGSKKASVKMVHNYIS